MEILSAIPGKSLPLFMGRSFCKFEKKTIHGNKSLNRLFIGKIAFQVHFWYAKRVGPIRVKFPVIVNYRNWKRSSRIGAVLQPYN